MVNKALRLSFLSNTEVETCPDFNGSYHGFAWGTYKSITDLQKEEVGQFDVVGQVVACEDLDNYDNNGKAGKKSPTLLDDEGNEIHCTLWGDFAQQLNDFLNTCGDGLFCPSTCNDEVLGWQDVCTKMGNEKQNCIFLMEVDIIKKTENQAKMTKLSMNGKDCAKSRPKSKNAKVRVNTEESAVKPELETEEYF
ncbi:replication protein A 70 kDa DNA-binding subunit B [Tanacetum coccineum]